MSRRPRRNHTPAFKAKEALAAIKGEKTLADIAPLYTEGIHAGRGRAPAISAADLDRTARSALAAGADGLVFYHWTDFLLDGAEGGQKRSVLRALSRE